MTSHPPPDSSFAWDEWQAAPAAAEGWSGAAAPASPALAAEPFGLLPADDWMQSQPQETAHDHQSWTSAHEEAAAWLPQRHAPPADSDCEDDAREQEDAGWMREAQPAAVAWSESSAASVAPIPFVLQAGALHPGSLASTPASSVAYASASSGAEHGPSRMRACAPCFKLKQRCDDQRPCARCVSRGVECVPVEAKQRRKRANTPKQPPPVPVEEHFHVVAAAAAAAPAFSAVALTTSPMDVLSAQLCSRSRLDIFTQMGTRDALLAMHRRFSAMPPQVSLFMQLPIAIAKLHLELTEMMNEQDFVLFLANGLTPADIASPLYQTSPLAPWLHPATRPMFAAYPPGPTQCERGDLTRIREPGEVRSPESLALEDANAPAQIRCSWLPEAVLAFNRWKRMCYTGPQHVRRSSQSVHSDDPLWRYAESSLAVTDDAHRSQVMAGVAEAAKRMAPNEAELLEARLAYLTLEHAPADGSTVLAGGIQQLHARWCPLQNEDARDSSESHKKARVASASAAPVDDSAAPACVCGRSVALPRLVVINSAFERLFGWTQAEVSQLVAREGCLMFLRRLHPPSVWPELQRVEATLVHDLIDLSGKLVDAIECRLKAAAADPSQAESTEAMFASLASTAMNDAAAAASPSFATAATSAAPFSPLVRSQLPLTQLRTHLLTRSGQLLACETRGAWHPDNETLESKGFVTEWRAVR